MRPEQDTFQQYSDFYKAKNGQKRSKKTKIDRCPNPMGIRVWKIELRELENYGTFALRRAKKVH